jgi:hypothetical protein
MGFRALSIVLAGKVADAAALAHGLPVAGVAGAATEAFLRDLLAVQDEQVQRLRRVEAGVQALLDQPWQSAQLHVREALLPGRPPEAVTLSLDRAGMELRRALVAMPDGSRARTYATFDLAVILLAVGDAPASALYAGEALRTFSEVYRAASRAEYEKVAGPYKPGTPAPLTRLNRYRSEESPRPALALEWLTLGVAVADLTRDRELIILERRRLPDDTLHAVELQAIGTPEAAEALATLRHASAERVARDFQSFLRLPVAVHAWSPDELPPVPPWWPVGGFPRGFLGRRA